ncbi:helix-turn-helix transcriptional regulator [Novosphingobium sp. Gsoil 351]|nr:helix-turn-helix transcriptional regulator [Novosphingobium sp. Gsoil 351]
MTTRLPIHVLDSDHGRRAQIARCAYALGHHAEVYSDPAELASFAPEGGVVVALEEAMRGGVSGLMGLLNREGRWLAVIATSSNPTIAKAVDAIKQGAMDYLPLPLDEGDLSLAIEKVAAEAELRRSRHLRQTAARSRLARLSGREREVVERMTLGLTNKEIGRELDISPRTVEIHRTNALTKLNARHSAEAIRLCFEGSDDSPRYQSALSA